MKPISYFRAVRQKRIHGDIKEIRHFHDKPQFGQGGPGFPLLDRTDGYPQHFRQLFLGQSALFPVSPDIFRDACFHAILFLSDYSNII